MRLDRLQILKIEGLGTRLSEPVTDSLSPWSIEQEALEPGSLGAWEPGRPGVWEMWSLGDVESGRCEAWEM